MRLGLFAVPLLLLLPTAFLLGQVQFGIKAGLSTSGLAPLDRSFDLPGGGSYRLRLQDLPPGYHLGGLLRMDIGVLVLQPEVLLDYASARFSLDSLGADATPLANLADGARETYFNLDVPLQIGLKLGPVRVSGGPEAHFFLASVSDLDALGYYEQRHPILTWGWEAGFGLDIWKLMVDFRFEGHLAEYGRHQTFFGQEGAFDSRLRRFLFQLAYRF